MKSVFTIKLSGDLDHVTIVEYNTTVTDLIKNNLEPFVLLLEMSEVDYMNSTAIGYMAEWYNTLSTNGSEMVVVGAGENIEDTLEVVGLGSRVKLFSTIVEFKEDFLKSQAQVTQ